MKLFLVSLSMLFAASIIGFLVVRVGAENWETQDAPGLPWTIWVATVVLLASSGTMVAGHRAIRAGNPGVLTPSLAVTGALGLAFLALQAVNWIGLYRAEVTADSSMVAFTFFMLTGLHGLHVVGGLIPLGLVIARAAGGRYTAGDHEGIDLMALYWHFLDVVWLILLAVQIVAG